MNLLSLIEGKRDGVRDVRLYSASGRGAKFALAHDSAHKAADFFSPPSMPSSYLTDRKGVIRHVHSGYRGAKTEAE